MDCTSLDGSGGTGSASWSIPVHLGGADMEEIGSRGGRANQVLGAAVFGRGTSA